MSTAQELWPICQCTRFLIRIQFEIPRFTKSMDHTYDLEVELLDPEFALMWASIAT